MSKRKGGWVGPLVAFMVSKVGMKDAIKVGTFITQWGIVARELGREPTQPEYSEYWGENRSTYFRDLLLLRRIWPGDKNPQRVWEWIEDQVPSTSKDESNLGVLLAAIQ